MDRTVVVVIVFVGAFLLTAAPTVAGWLGWWLGVLQEERERRRRIARGERYWYEYDDV